MADTTYIVLRRKRDQQPTESGWEVMTEVAASSARQAVTLGCGQEAGTYVAVPARSWKPVQVEAVQTTVLKLT